MAVPWSSCTPSCRRLDDWTYPLKCCVKVQGSKCPTDLSIRNAHGPTMRYKTNISIFRWHLNFRPIIVNRLRTNFTFESEKETQLSWAQKRKTCHHLNDLIYQKNFCRVERVNNISLRNCAGTERSEFWNDPWSTVISWQMLSALHSRQFFSSSCSYFCFFYALVEW